MAAANSNFSAKFLRCDAVTAAWEGGYVDHPADPGGPT
ncbi:MAG TPA: glycosyl hydrolase 108 family protein, partial [Devosia sp.]|nr:glycosyl hydrolase 108 family protein [Devosia sp.]